MKKIFVIFAAIALLTACSTTTEPAVDATDSTTIVTPTVDSTLLPVCDTTKCDTVKK
jgi:PBP1b-binding outer membrane lipoprotein LpoB